MLANFVSCQLLAYYGYIPTMSIWKLIYCIFEESLIQHSYIYAIEVNYLYIIIGPAQRVFIKRKLGENLPSSIPVIYRTNMEYDPATNTLKRKPDSRDHEAGLQLYSQAARLLKSIKKPLAVVSVCGRYRSGKSYFLSRMLGSADAFSLGHTMHACTFGIWMGTTILECDEYAILLIDTEGIDAVGSTGSSDASILVMTILLSSFMIYNSVHAPTRTDLEKMRYIAAVNLLRSE